MTTKRTVTNSRYKIGTNSWQNGKERRKRKASHSTSRTGVQKHKLRKTCRGERFEGRVEDRMVGTHGAKA